MLNKLLRVVMSFLIIINSFTTVGVFAEEEQITLQEEQPVATETIEVPEVQENLEEVVIEEDVVLQEVDEEIPQTEENIQEEIVDEVSIPEDLNLTSMRLIIAVADASVIRESTPVISSLDNMFLAQYESIEEAYKDYLYYQENAIFVEPDISFSVDTDTDVAAAEEIFMTQEENPFTELSNELSDGKTTVSNDVIIGLIDTGIGTNYNVINSISVLDSDPTDYNGHGSKMADFILQENSDAKILSIKALDDNGIGTTSSVYSALKYAVESNVNVISMSFSSFDSADSNVIREAIEEAKNKGIVVIGSAGNKNLDVKYFIPGNIDYVTTVNASNEDGSKYVTSNYGDLVDWSVVAESSSEATAKLTGIASFNIETTGYPFSVLPDRVMAPENSFREEQVLPLLENAKFGTDINDLYYLVDFSGDVSQSEVIRFKDGVPSNMVTYGYDGAGNYIGQSPYYITSGGGPTFVTNDDVITLWNEIGGTYHGKPFGVKATYERLDKGDFVGETNQHGSKFHLSTMRSQTPEGDPYSHYAGTGALNVITYGGKLIRVTVTLYEDVPTGSTRPAGTPIKLGSKADYILMGPLGLTNEMAKQQTIEFFAVDEPAKVYSYVKPDNKSDVANQPFSYNGGTVTAWYSSYSSNSAGAAGARRNTSFLRDVKGETDVTFYVGIIGSLNPSTSDWYDGDPTMWFSIGGISALTSKPVVEIGNPSIEKAIHAPDDTRVEELILDKEDVTYPYIIDFTLPEQEEGGWYSSLEVEDKLDEFLSIVGDVSIGTPSGDLNIGEDKSELFNISTENNTIKVSMKEEALKYEENEANPNYNKTYRIKFNVRKALSSEMTPQQLKKFVESHPDYRIKNTAVIKVQKYMWDKPEGDPEETPSNEVVTQYPHGLVIRYFKIKDADNNGVEDTPNDYSDNVKLYEDYVDGTVGAGDKYRVESPNLEDGTTYPYGELSEEGYRIVAGQKPDSQCPELNKDQPFVSGKMPTDFYVLDVYYEPHVLKINYLEEGTNVVLWKQFVDRSKGKWDEYAVPSPKIAGYSLVSPTDSIVSGIMPSNNHEIDVFYNKDPMLGSQITAYKSSDPITGTVVAPGDKITYTITVKNTGVSTSQPIDVRDSIPVGTSFSDVFDNGVYSADSNSVSWKLEPLAAREETSVSFEVIVDEGFDSIVYNMAEYKTEPENIYRQTNLTIHPTNTEERGPAALESKKGGAVETSTTTTTTTTKNISGSQSFAYSENTQSFTAPEKGTYTFTLNGASGGKLTGVYSTAVSNKTYDGDNIPTNRGNKLVVNVELEKNQTVYILTGGKGVDILNACSNKSVNGRWGYTTMAVCKTAGTNGGFNGGGKGGNGWRYSSGDYYYDGGKATYGGGTGGGGATQITTTDRGTLNNFSNHRDEVIAVAGGGGGITGGGYDYERNDGTEGSYGVGGNGSNGKTPGSNYADGAGGGGAGINGGKGGSDNGRGATGTNFVNTNLATQTSVSTNGAPINSNGSVSVSWNFDIPDTTTSTTTGSDNGSGIIDWPDENAPSGDAGVDVSATGELTYTINLANNGAETSHGTVITDEIPNGTTFVPGSIEFIDANGVTNALEDETNYNMSKNRVEVFVGDLPSGKSVSLKFKVTIDGTVRLIQNQGKFGRGYQEKDLSITDPKHSTNIVEYVLPGKIMIKKLWLDGDKTSQRPESLTVYIKGTDEEVTTVRLYEKDGWETEVEIPWNAEAPVYQVYEDEIPGYDCKNTIDNPIILDYNEDPSGVVILRNPLLTYKITTEVINGVIDDAIYDIPAGSDEQISYAPYPEHSLVSIEVDGVKLDDLTEIVSLYKFLNVNADHHIKVVYQPDFSNTQPIKNVYDDKGNDIHGEYVDKNSTLHYEISVRNVSFQDLSVTITDPISPELSEVTPLDGGVYENGTITWNFTVPAREVAKVRFTAIAPNNKSVIKNKATVVPHYDGKDYFLETNEVTNYTGVELTISKTVSGNMRQKNKEFEFIVKVGKTNTIMTRTLGGGVEFIPGTKIYGWDWKDEINHQNHLEDLVIKDGETRTLTATMNGTPFYTLKADKSMMGQSVLSEDEIYTSLGRPFEEGTAPEFLIFDSPSSFDYPPPFSSFSLIVSDEILPEVYPQGTIFTLEERNVLDLSEYGGIDNGDGTYTFKLKHGDSITIDNIPVDMEYEVIEKDYSGDGYITIVNGVEGREASGILQDNVNIQFENIREFVVPTGIGLGISVTLPVIMLAAILFIIKKRKPLVN